MKEFSLKINQIINDITEHESKNILDYTEPMDYHMLIRYLDEFSRRYPYMCVGYLGESILGKRIPIITLGEGKKSDLHYRLH